MKIIHTSIFENAENYERARIPGIVRAENGELIAYCELRRAPGDWAVIDIGMKKSSDGAKSWGERRILVSSEGVNTVNNPVMIADGNCIHFLYCLNYRRVFYMKSEDAGESWSQSRELTDSIKAQTGDYFWSCIATGPTHGIKTLSGRLIVPLWLAYNKEDEKSHHPSVIAVLYSDDNGDSWHIGKAFGGLSDPSEFAVAQLSSGKLVVNIRHENPERCRAVGELNEDMEICDVTFADFLPDPVCCAGMCSSGDSIFFSNCADATARKMLTLRKLSRELSLTESFLISEEAGYSDIACSDGDKTVYVLYESGKELFCAAVSVN